MLNMVVRVVVTEKVTTEKRFKGCRGVDFAASRGRASKAGGS